MTQKFLKLIIITIIFTLVFPVANGSAVGDKAPPILNSLEIKSKELNIGDTLEIAADVTDDLSGVRDIFILFHNTKSGMTKTKNFSLQFDEKSNLWKANYTIKETDIDGKWEIESIQLWDVAGNYHHTYKTSLPNQENFFYIINNPNELDSTGPTFEKGEINVSTLEAGQEFIIKVKASDDSGIKSVSAKYRKPNGKSSIGIDFQFDVETGFWIGKYIINPHAPAGIWNLSAISDLR